jgi:hypothetical protein
MGRGSTRRRKSAAWGDTIVSLLPSCDRTRLTKRKESGETKTKAEAEEWSEQAADGRARSYNGGVRITITPRRSASPLRPSPAPAEPETSAFHQPMVAAQNRLSGLEAGVAELATVRYTADSIMHFIIYPSTETSNQQQIIIVSTHGPVMRASARGQAPSGAPRARAQPAQAQARSPPPAQRRARATPRGRPPPRASHRAAP